MLCRSLGIGSVGDIFRERFPAFLFWRAWLPQVLYGEFVPRPDGSVIETGVRSYPQSWIFPVMFLTALLLLGGKDWVLGVLQLLRGQRSLDDAWVALLLLPFLLLVGALWLFDTEPGRKKLFDFIKDTLEAREIERRVAGVSTV